MERMSLGVIGRLLRKPRGAIYIFESSECSHGTF